MEETVGRAEAVFYEALQITDTAGRADFLERACAGESPLRSTVDELLDAHGEAGKFFQASEPAMKPPGGLADEWTNASAYTDASVGSRVGPYKLVQWLGEGGGGVVYRVEQEKPMRREVALKIIKLGMDTKRVIARFEAERQTLALMDHPNIARVLEAGATETGRPFFVMELVRGTRITDYCELNLVPLEQRLALFQQVCHAIQHAHQKGVIHRDIKPSNILITLQDGAPVPKVIDFGIAKATAGPLAEGTVFTGFEPMIGTPAYMSPEQVNGEGDVDTQSDIYSLGVVLYELLTTRPPFDNVELLHAGVDGMRRTLRERDPLRPSLMVEALLRENKIMTRHDRPIVPVIPAAALRGDLDWIVMKALEKDRERRYQTARGLTFDIERYLSNEPVLARPPSRRYWLQKLVRRNKVIFSAAAAVTAALVLGLGTSTWLFFKERESRREAERGRANETLLRQQAEARVIISRALLMLEQKRFEEADRLVGETASSDTALVGATVFRSLGDWVALHGRWRRAAEYLSILVHVSQFEASDVSALDHTKLAVALIELADYPHYENFRRESIKHFGGTVDPLVAERTFKNCLLLPASPGLLASLAPLADIAAKSILEKTAPGNSWLIPWRCLSLSLMEYRRGHYAGAIAWGDRSLSYTPRNPVRTATINAIRAMSYHRLGRPADARSELMQCRKAIDRVFKDGKFLVDGLQRDWFDWVLCRILEREATAAIDKPPATLP